MLHVHVVQIKKWILGDYSEISFEFGPNTDVYQSCSVTFRGHFYLFGGGNEPRQVKLYLIADRSCFKPCLD